MKAMENHSCVVYRLVDACFMTYWLSMNGRSKSGIIRIIKSFDFFFLVGGKCRHYFEQRFFVLL
jgi:hypothetical protein